MIIKEIMERTFFKTVVYSFSLAILITSCSVDSLNQPISTNDSSVDIFKSDSNLKPAIISQEIQQQITSNLIEETEWGMNVKNLPTVKQKAKATVISYLGFDNDKGGYRDELRQLLNFHELSGSSNIMNMILQTDGADQKDLKRYFVVGDSDSSKTVSPYTKFKYERDSADYRVLQAFIKWSYSTYPSQLKLLDIDSHGGSFFGITRDDTTGKTISLPDVTKAIKSSTGKVDLLTFDACLMGSAEVLYEIKDVANVIVGSQDSTLGTGLLYTKALPGIISSSKNIDEIGRNIVLASDRQGKDFLRRPNKKGNVPNVFTLAAYKGSLIKPFVNELNSLSKLLISKIPSQKQAIKQAINGSSPMNVDGDDLGGQRDIYEILGRLNTIITDSQVKDSITKTRNNLNKSILISRTHNSEKNAQGMAINISASSVSSDDYKNTAFAKETSWDELILAINK